MHLEFDRMCCEDRIWLVKAILNLAIQYANARDYKDITNAFFLEMERSHSITCDWI